MPPALVESGPGTPREALFCKPGTSEENFLYNIKLQCSHPPLHMPKPFPAHRILLRWSEWLQQIAQGLPPLGTAWGGALRLRPILYTLAVFTNCSPLDDFSTICSLRCFLPSSRDPGCKHASLQFSSFSMCFTAYLEACTSRGRRWEALASLPLSMLAQHAGRSCRPQQRPPWINSTVTSWHTMWEITTGMGAKNGSKTGFLEQIQSQGLEKDSSMHFFCSKYHANVSLNGIHQ